MTRSSPRPGGRLCGDCLEAVVHRLAQRLTALRGALELALTFASAPEEYRAALQHSLEQADVLIDLLGSLREMGGGSSEDSTPKVLRLDEVLRETGEEFRAQRSSWGVDIVLETVGPVSILAEPQRLRAAVARLLQALLQGKDRYGVVRLATSVDAGRACLTVTDERLPAPSTAFGDGPGARTPGEDFAAAAKTGHLDWALARRLLEGAGGAIELTASSRSVCLLRVLWPIAQGAAA